MILGEAGQNGIGADGGLYYRGKDPLLPFHELGEETCKMMPIT